MRRVFLACLFVLLSVPAVAGTRYEFKATGVESAQLTIEAVGDIEAIEPLIKDFQVLEPGLSITYVDNLTNDLFEMLQAACDKDLVVADLVFSSAVDHMVKLANDGCAQPHTSSETSRAPPFASWHDEVFGFSFEPAVIVYNRKLVPPSDVPRSRDQLVDLLRSKAETYNNRIGTYDIARSGIGYLFGFFDAQQSSAFGRMMEGFGRANAGLYCCTGELLRDIESGKVLIGYNLLGSYAYGRFKAGAPIGIVLPRDYTLVLSRAAFVPTHAANPQAGKKFLDYLLSLRGQRTAAEKSFFFAYGQAAPEGVDAAEPELQSGIYRPIPLGPALLAVTDRHKKARLLKEWNQSFQRR
jgi:iron(III) transport system substrate-binding protein